MTGAGHIDEATVLRFADGELQGDAAAAVVRHLEQCADCRQLFDEHAQFDAQVAAALPVSASLRAELRMRAAAVMRGGPAASSSLLAWRRLAVVAVAASVLIAGSLWFAAGTGDHCIVQRERVAATTRGAEERLHLDVRIGVRCWPVVFGRRADGRCERLLPHSDPTLGWLGVEVPVSVGRTARLPGADLFDFGLDAMSPWVELIVLPWPTSPDATVLQTVADLLSSSPRGELPAAVVQRAPRAQRVAVPPAK